MQKQQTAGIEGGGIVAVTDWLVFQQSPIHGTGGFARRNIPGGTRIIEYVGPKISKAESMARCEENNQYIFSLNDHQDIDGNVEWNPARYINHSCTPNCDAELDADRVWIVANRDIRAGEEVAFNYGFDLEEYKEYPCRCGAARCLGYMVAEEFHDHIRKQQALSASL